MEELDEFGIPIKKPTAKNVDEFGIPIKKKESSVSTSTTATPNSVSNGGTTFSDTSKTKGFPKIDTNSVAPGFGEQPKPESSIEKEKRLRKKLSTIKVTPENMEEISADTDALSALQKANKKNTPVQTNDVKGFGGGLLNRLDTGIAIASKSFYDSPKMILDAIYAPQNYIAKKLDIPSLKVDPEKYAYENIPSKVMDEVISKNNKNIENYKKEIGGDVVSAFDKGDYTNTFKHAALNSMESLPLIGATMATGGESLLANSIMIGSSASTQYDQLGKENPEMDTNVKLANAAVNGTLEVLVGKFMEGIGGNVWKNVLSSKGAKETTKIATNSFRKTLEKVVGDSPIIGVASEYAEERITDGLQQFNDIATGVSTEFNWDQNRNAGLSSLGFGLPNATALYASKAYISNKARLKVKSSNKEIISLQNELNNPDLSTENKKIISDNISKIYDENKSLLGAELEKLNAIQDVHKKELVAIDKSMDKSKSDAIDIKHDSNISDEAKASLLIKLKEDFKKNLDRKNEILTKTPFELLPGNEQAKRETQASREIMKKENPDGTKNITIDAEETKKLASETYDKELLDKKIADEQAQKPITEAQQEAQPKAEEQKTEQEVLNTTVEDIVAPSVEDVEKKRNSDLNEFSPVPSISEEQKMQFGTGYKDFNFKKESISIDKVKITEQPSLSEKQELVEDIKKNGIKEPIVVEYDKESDIYYVKNGNHRAAIAKELGIKEIPSIVAEYKDTKNEAAPETNTPIDGNIQSGASDVGEAGTTNQESPIQENLPSSVDGGENKGAIEVEKSKKYKLSEKGQAFNVQNKNGILVVTNNKGEKVSKPTERAVLRKHSDQLDFTKGEKAIDDINFEPKDWDNEISKKSNNPSEVAEAIIYAQNEDASSLTPEEKTDYKKQIISDGFVKIKEEGFNRFGDRNNKTSKTAKAYFDENGRDIDDLALELSGISGIEISPEDITDFITDNPNGLKAIKSKEKENLSQEQINKQNKITNLKNRFTELTGLDAKPEFLFKAIQQLNRKFELNSVLDEMSDSDFEKIENNYKQFEQEQNGAKETKQIGERNDEVENPKNGGEKSRTKGNDIVNEKPTRKTAEERIKISDAKVDDWKNAIKDIDSIFGIKIKVDDIEGLNKNGVDIIDVIANIAKQAIAAGIHIDEAINKTIEHLKKTIDFDVNIDDVKERINPKKEADNDFKSKPRKKSLLNRAFEGGNSELITDAIEEHGLNYTIENQEEAKKRAEEFVNQVGPANALEAVRSNQIKGAEKAFVYSTVIDNLLSEIESTTNLDEKEKLESEHAQIIADITNEFSQESTDAGRFISALNKVYNSSKLRYNLTAQIESHKASNNGQISDEVLEKFTKADKRIKELEKLIEEAEAKAKKAEDELAIKNVQEDIDRKKNNTSISKKSKELANKIRQAKIHKPGIFSSATPASLVWDGAIEIVAKSIETGGSITEAIQKGLEYIRKSKWYKQLSNEQQQEAENTFNESLNKTEKTTSTITIGKNGKIKIPAQLFRDYVEAGENDIDVIASKIKEDIADEFPDVDVRDIRDALSGYGKQINPQKDEISKEINRLRNVGKLISAYEDALRGKSPLKSGLKREKPTQQMRELKKEINRLIKENGLDAVDLEKQWASALDKVKSSLKNQIEDLDKQISNGEKRKVERTTTKLDEEATDLKNIRDAKKQILDDLVGKPELTEEQLIARAEKSLQTSIDKLQKEIINGNISYNEKPTPKQSEKLDNLRKERQALVDIRNKMREEAGLVEAQRLANTKKRVLSQIKNLKERIDNKDYSKKEVKPLIEDSELSQLRAEKLRQQEIYDAQKYADELKNRSGLKKWVDAVLEIWNVPRILKATGELSTVLVQGGILTTSRKLTNPRALAKIMKELFVSIGSAKKAAYYESLIKAHPLYPLAEKSKLALTNPDYKSDVREEQFSGDYANLAWDLPFILASYNKKLEKVTNAKKSILGDVIKKTIGIGKSGTDKLSIREQWKNINPFLALERGGTLYMNTLRMEEFARGCEMLRMEGKNEVDHLQDYKLLANAVNSMTGRANLPSTIATSSKTLAAVFFSARNAVSIVNQVNPIYYGYLHFGSSDGFQLKKTSVANKLAVNNMIRFVAITGAMVLAIKASAGKDDDGEDIVQIELDPNSSDFMKMKIGDIRFDPWHGMTTMIVLMSRLISENVKSTSTGETTKLGEKRFGPQDRWDLLGIWARNKLSPSAAIAANYLSTHEEIDKSTGESFRETPFGGKFSEDESLDLTPMYWSSVKEIQAENPGSMAEFLTVVSVFGWNTAVYKPSDKKQSKKSMPGVPNFGAMKMNP